MMRGALVRVKRNHGLLMQQIIGNSVTKYKRRTLDSKLMSTGNYLQFVDFANSTVKNRLPYNSEIMRWILLKLSEKNYYYVAYRFSTFHLTLNVSFFNFQQLWTQTSPSVYPVIGIPYTL